MIRNDTHYYTALRHLQVLADEISELRKVANDNAALKLMARKERFANALRRHISAYLSSQQPDSGPDAISIASGRTKGVSPGYGLFLARASRSLTQAEISQAMGVKQPVVSRIENGGDSARARGKIDTLDGSEESDATTQGEAITTRTLERWADATGYNLNIVLTQEGTGWGDSTSLNSFALNAITFRNQFCHQPDYLLSQLLLELAVATSADVITCYLGDESPDHLRLVFSNGTHSLYGMDGMILRANVPIKVLDDAPAFVADLQDDVRYADSTFAVREGICSACHIPFQAGFFRGVVFLSYRQKPNPVSAEYIERLMSVHSILSWCLTNIDHTKIPTVGTIPKLGADSQPVGEVAANLARFLEATFGFADENSSWSGLAVKNMLSSLAEELELGSGHVWIDLFDEDGRSAEVARLVVGEAESCEAIGSRNLKSLIREYVQNECYFVVSRERRNSRVSRLLQSLGFPEHALASVPLIDDSKNSIFGALSLLVPEERSFRTREIHKSISTAVALCKGPTRLNVRLRVSGMEGSIVIGSLLLRGTYAIRSVKRLHLNSVYLSLADLINNVFGADLTDIWLVDWPDAKINLEEGARAESELFDSRFGNDSSKALFYPRSGRVFSRDFAW